jgi:ribosome-binding protein aMBF1 (putative translation factor)
MGHTVTVTIDGKEYVAVPRADYLRMTGGKDLEGAVDAVEYTRRSLGKSLRAAREAAGLSQAELAAKLGKAQPMISGAESGTVRVGERHVSAVLKACGLPKDWKASKRRGARAADK